MSCKNPGTFGPWTTEVAQASRLRPVVGGPIFVMPWQRFKVTKQYKAIIVVRQGWLSAMLRSLPLDLFSSCEVGILLLGFGKGLAAKCSVSARQLSQGSGCCGIRLLCPFHPPSCARLLQSCSHLSTAREKIPAFCGRWGRQFASHVQLTRPVLGCSHVLAYMCYTAT